jgi:nitrogen fixation protein NifU and related proteins
MYNSDDDDEFLELYQQLVLEHSKKPRNFGTLQCKCQSHGKNPSCGDELFLFLNIEDQKIKDVKFNGQGCSLSISSASLMTQSIKNMNIEQVKELTQRFTHFIMDKQPLLDSDEPLHIYKGVHEFPARVKCVLLPWRTLQSILNGDCYE